MGFAGAKAMMGAAGADASRTASSWTERSNSQNVPLRDVEYGNGRMFAAGNDFGTKFYLTFSDDGGATWTEDTGVGDETKYGVGYGNDGGTHRWKIVGTFSTGSDLNFSSNNGDSWFFAEPWIGGTYRRIRYQAENNQWMGVGSNDDIIGVSSSFTDNIPNNGNGGGSADGPFFDLVFGPGDLTIIVGAADIEYGNYTGEGLTWTARTHPKSFALYGIAYSVDLDLYVAVGAADGTDAYIITASDHTGTWTERSNPKNFALFDVVYADGLFVAVGQADGSDAYIVTSPDGINWTEQTNPKNVTLLGITYDETEEVFCAVGEADGSDAYIITSAA